MGKYFVRRLNVLFGLFFLSISWFAGADDLPGYQQIRPQTHCSTYVSFRREENSSWLGRTFLNQGKTVWRLDETSGFDLGVVPSVENFAQIQKEIQKLSQNFDKQASERIRVVFNGLNIDQSTQLKKEFKQWMRDRPELNDVSVRTFPISQGLGDSFRLWWPSYSRHYQTPKKEEIIQGIYATLTVELLSAAAIYFISGKGPDETAMVLLRHGGLLGLITIWQKTHMNWIVDKGSGAFGKWMKQVITSSAFILNYIDPQTWLEFAKAVPRSMISSPIQTAFYHFVSTMGVRQWQLKLPAEQAERGQAFSNWAAVPLLIPDAILLFIGSQTDVSYLGLQSLYWGQAGIAALTASGYVVMTKTRYLDEAFAYYKTTIKETSKGRVETLTTNDSQP